MKSIPLFIFPFALAVSLSACTPPDNASSATQKAPDVQASAELPAADQAAPIASPEAALPALAALDETRTAEVLIAASKCNLESFGSKPFSAEEVALSMTSNIKASGWLMAEKADVSIMDPVLRIENADKAKIWEVPVKLAIAREDLQATATPGFEVSFDGSALLAGRYHAYLAYRVDGVLYGCDNGRYVSVH